MGFFPNVRPSISYISEEGLCSQILIIRYVSSCCSSGIKIVHYIENMLAIFLTSKCVSPIWLVLHADCYVCNMIGSSLLWSGTLMGIIFVM